MKKILITGANGFIGQNILNFFLETSVNEFILVDRYFDDNSVYLNPRIKLIKHNIEIAFDDEMIFDVDVVIHLAALVGETVCIKDIDRTIKVNIIGTHNILKKLDVKKLKKFIFFSTSNIYLPNNNMPIKESGDINTSSIYSTTKLASEAIITNFFQDLPISYYLCRVSNVYGPRHNAPTIINNIIKQFLQKSFIEIFGPQDKRGFLYIDDVIAGINLLINEEVEPGKYNFGGKESVRILDIVNQCSQILNKQMKIITKDKPERSLFLDSSKIRQEGWKPRVDISEGLKNCINKYKEGKSYDKKK